MKIVIKVGSSTLTHASGKLDFRMIDRLVRVIADIKNNGHQVVLVSSGAQVAGMARLRLEKKPEEITKKQIMTKAPASAGAFLFAKYLTIFH